MLKTLIASVIIGTALGAALPAAADNVRHDTGRHYEHQRHYGAHRDRAFRPVVYAVRFHDYRRFIHRHGRHATHSRRFIRWAQKHGRPLGPRDYGRWSGPSAYGFFPAQDFGKGYGWGRPRWVYVNVRTGRIWF